MSAIVIKNLNLTIKKKKVLTNVSLDIPKGKVCAFIGPNGAGKTTTIKCILDLYKGYTGEILIEDTLNSNKKSREHIGYIPEKENFPKLKVSVFLSTLSKIYGFADNRYLNFINEHKQYFDISPFINNRLDQLSSGQKKQVMILQSLIGNPNILIMDEPTENMDPTMRQNFYKLIKELVNKGKTIFISTHQLDEIKENINWMIFINNGEIKYQDEVDKTKDLYKMYNEFLQS